MEDQIPEKIKSERSEIVRKVADESKRKFRQSFIGKSQIVLVESFDKNGYAKGYGENYVPILVKEKHLVKNTLVKVLIVDIEQGDDPRLIGTLQETAGFETHK